VIGVSLDIHNYRTAHNRHRPRAGGETFESELVSNYYSYRVVVPIAISLLFALFYLIALTVLILFWLRYYRNMGYFLIVTYPESLKN